MSIEIAGLVIGVIFLVFISVLRNALSQTFFNYTLDLLPKDFLPPNSWNDLYVEAKNELERLDFKHVGWLSIKSKSSELLEEYSVISIY